jgi:hypothetical protein
MIERRERVSAADRVAKHRDKVIQDGGKRTTVTIQPEAVRASDELIERGYASTLTEAINRSLLEARRNIEKA